MSKGQLIFANGVVIKGDLLGRKNMSTDIFVSGIVTPYNGLTDYQSVLCDPAASGQLLCMTYPLIGNIGRVKGQDLLPEKIQAAGLIIRESIGEVDHWLSLESLRDWLSREKKLAICGVDTREIVRMLRREGPMAAAIGLDDPLQTEKMLASLKTFSNKNLNDVYAGLPRKQVFMSKPGGLTDQQIDNQPELADTISKQSDRSSTLMSSGAVRKVSVLNLGMQPGQIKALTSRGCQVTVIPLPDAPDKITQIQADTLLTELIADKPDAVLLSSGPEEIAEKAALPLLKLINTLYDQTTLWAIDSGHLLLARACGLKLKKLPLGHHGANYPVYEIVSGRTYITGQHHQLTVDPVSLQDVQTISQSYKNINDQSVEGLIYDQRHFSIQFLPDVDSHAHQTGHIWDQLVARLG